MRFECCIDNCISQTKIDIIVFNNFKFRIHKVNSDENGNKLIIDIIMEGKRLTLINIYGPNRDHPDFYNKILTYIKQTTYPVILAGYLKLKDKQ